MSLGRYPEVSLKEAREKREELRKQVAAGTDPGKIRQLTKLALVNGSGNTFEAIAREWFQMYSGAWNPEYQATVVRRLETDAFPWIGSSPTSSLKPLNVLAVLRRIQKRGALVEPKAVGALMRAIDGYQGYFLTRCALRSSALLFVRQGELRKAEWSEIDFENCEWRIGSGHSRSTTSDASCSCARAAANAERCRRQPAYVSEEAHQR
jgi:integrase